MLVIVNVTVRLQWKEYVFAQPFESLLHQIWLQTPTMLPSSFNTWLDRKWQKMVNEFTPVATFLASTLYKFIEKNFVPMQLQL